MRRLGSSRCLVACALWALVASAVGATELPPEGRCPGDPGSAADTGDTASSAGEVVDATRAPTRLRPGATISYADLAAIRELLPREVWRHRDVFFFDGMRLTLGACHRRFAPSPAFAAAMRGRAGDARVDADGNLDRFSGGLPFAIEALDAHAPNAGARWAWNLERRDRGSGSTGSFRIVDLPDARMLADYAAPQTYSGTFFLVSGDEASPNRWVAGGELREPPDARQLAWRQYRLRAADRDARRPDDVFVYLPALRKMRRAVGARSDGIFLPRYRVAGPGNARAVPFAQGGRLGTIEAGHGGALAVAEDIERGFTGLALRPNAWTWRVVAEQAVIAPLNARVPGWPLREGRNHGPSGLSLASDTWDVRWAVVIEGRARDGDRPLPSVTHWMDAQTAQPLYVIRRAPSGAVREVGVLAHRYSSDDPRLSNGDPANVFDPVAAAFLTLPSGGWRRESWDVRAAQLDPAERRALLSTDALTRGR
jgi:hypothetical protein